MLRAMFKNSYKTNDIKPIIILCKDNYIYRKTTEKEITSKLFNEQNNKEHNKLH